MTDCTAFKEPIYVTRPVVPTIEEVTAKLREIWDSKWLTTMGRSISSWKRNWNKH